MSRLRRMVGALAVGSLLALTAGGDASAGVLGGYRNCYSRFLGANSDSLGFTTHAIGSQDWSWNNTTRRARYSTSGYHAEYWGVAASSLYSASSACRN
ncbi:MAG: hypothetical protein ACK5OX_09435 [Desertimonas sp.]